LSKRQFANPIRQEWKAPMKQALIIGLMAFGIATSAYAQGPNGPGSSGPHDPNPPASSPDLKLPAPCGAETHVAQENAAGPIGGSGSDHPGAATPEDRLADTECAKNGLPSGNTAVPSTAGPSPK
jgi:hypothetical protein